MSKWRRLLVLVLLLAGCSTPYDPYSEGVVVQKWSTGGRGGLVKGDAGGFEVEWVPWEYWATIRNCHEGKCIEYDVVGIGDTAWINLKVGDRFLVKMQGAHVRDWGPSPKPPENRPLN